MQTHKTWPIRVAASILAVAFGMQWVLLHVVVLGVSVLTLSPDTSPSESSSGLIESHENCQACNILAEQEQKDESPQSSVTSELLEIEGVSHRISLVSGAKDLYLTQILDPAHLNYPPYHFSSKKPPQSTA